MTPQDDQNLDVQTAGMDVESLTAVQGLIERLSNQLDELLQKQKEFSSMIKSIIDNDEQLAKAVTAAEELTSEIKTRKQALQESPEIKELKVKVADVKEDIKMVQESLTTHLVNYFQMTGSTAVDLPSGDEREFVLKARMKPKKK